MNIRDGRERERERERKRERGREREGEREGERGRERGRKNTCVTTVVDPMLYAINQTYGHLLKGIRKRCMLLLHISCLLNRTVREIT